MPKYHINISLSTAAYDILEVLAEGAQLSKSGYIESLLLIKERTQSTEHTVRKEKPVQRTIQRDKQPKRPVEPKYTPDKDKPSEGLNQGSMRSNDVAAIMRQRMDQA